MDKIIKAIVADDHRVLRKGLILSLEGLNNIKVVGEASDGQEVLKILEGEIVHLVLMDIEMPNLNGLATTKIIKERYPFTKIIIVSMFKEKTIVKKVFEAGAHGFVTKNISDEELGRAIEQIRAGKKYLAAELQTELIEDYINEQPKPGIKGALSKRELEIVGYIEQGLTSKEIADKLFLSLKTIETHRGNIYKKLNVKNVVELVTKLKQENY
ncbi:MAG TPA: response regulator transcription factor [Cytophagaceae bacterium]